MQASHKFLCCVHVTSVPKKAFYCNPDASGLRLDKGSKTPFSLSLNNHVQHLSLMLLPALQAAHEVDDARNAAAKTEAEATGLRAALEAARNRHFEQLTK